MEYSSCSCCCWWWCWCGGSILQLEDGILTTAHGTGTRVLYAATLPRPLPSASRLHLRSVGPPLPVPRTGDVQAASTPPRACLWPHLRRKASPPTARGRFLLLLAFFYVFLLFPASTAPQNRGAQGQAQYCPSALCARGHAGPPQPRPSDPGREDGEGGAGRRPFAVVTSAAREESSGTRGGGGARDSGRGTARLSEGEGTLRAVPTAAAQRWRQPLCERSRRTADHQLLEATCHLSHRRRPLHFWQSRYGYIIVIIPMAPSVTVTLTADGFMLVRRHG